MPDVPRPGRTGKYIELSDDLIARLDAFCRSRDSTFAAEVREAIRRHLDYPPPVSAPLPRGRKKVSEKKWQERLT